MTKKDNKNINDTTNHRIRKIRHWRKPALSIPANQTAKCQVEHDCAMTCDWKPIPIPQGYD